MDDDSTIESVGRPFTPELVDTVAAGANGPRPSSASASASMSMSRPVGSSVGRYVVLDELGRGGMGRVVRAYDPKLQREVAIKEVRRAMLDEELIKRLVVEARAMAKLSHPHVVPVYDVEELPDGAVALIMEYVAGQTLRQWLQQPEHDWRTVVRRFIAAGRGLAAAHAAGLLHRDFKPANVLIGSDGTVKVTDFGLAKGTGSLEGSSSSQASAPTEEVEDLTAVGTVMGTPRYMAPEQLRGAPLTPAADQYSFCVALWEGLCGTPPFLGKAITDKHHGPPAWPRPTIPGPIVRAVTRGLAPKPGDRWPSMGALLDALAWDPARRRNRWLMAVGCVGVLGSGGVAWHTLAEDQAERCTGAESRLVGIWDDARREEVAAAVLAIDKPYAALAWERTRGELDDYASAWTSMHVEACEATTVRGEQSTEAMDLRMACLHRAAVELGAVTTQLSQADAGVVQNAHRLTGSLRPLSRCADLEALRQAVEPPIPREAEAVEAVRAQVRAARTAEATGRYDQAKEAIAAAKAALEGLEYGPVKTEVALTEGLVLERIGDYEASGAAYQRTVELGARWRQWEEVTEAATQLLFVVGSRLLRSAEVLRYAALARGLATGDLRREARLAFAMGSIHHELAQYSEAEVEHRRNVTLLEQAFGPEHLYVAMARINLASTLRELDRQEEAEAEHRRGLARMEGILGRGHPHTAGSRHNFALVLADQGKYVEAEAEHRQALAQMEEALGPEHPHVAAARDNLALALKGQGRYEEAEAEHRVALRLREQALGPEHPVVAGSRSNLGGILYARGRYEEAEVEHRRALVLWEQAFGAEHPQVAEARINLAGSLGAQGKYEDAEAELRRGLATLDQAMGPEHPHVATSRHLLASLLLERERPDDARALAELAWERRQREDIAPAERAETAFLLARAQWESREAIEDRARARALAEQAVEAYRQAITTGGAHDEDVRGIEQWLDAHRVDTQ